MLRNGKRVSGFASPERRQAWCLALCLLILSIAPLGAARQGKAGTEAAPKRLQTAVGCLVAARFVQQDDLTYLGLKVGDWAWARYRIGSLPGMEPTPGLFNVVLYSADGRSGMLLFADPNKQGGFEVILNAYRLHKHGSRWSADYGNGGYVLYEAIGRDVTALSSRPRYRVRLSPGGSECTQDTAAQ
jgi:hypothetical protein